MSISLNASARAAESVNAPREQSYVLCTAVIILGVIGACAVAAWFYGDALPVDASMVGP